MQKITTFLWFDSQAEDAAKFYTSVFKNSSIGTVARYVEGGPGPVGEVMTVGFNLDGVEFAALNGGPVFKFNPSISLVVNVETQEELDHYWTSLVDEGEEVQCGWLKDKFGLSWQIVPTILPQLLSDPDPVKAGRAMQAMLGMTKLDMHALQSAFDGE